MAPSFITRYITFFLLFVYSISVEIHDTDATFSFSFSKFNKTTIFGSEIVIDGNIELRNSTVLIFNRGMMMYQKPIEFIGKAPSFSSHFAFYGHGNDDILEFFMAPNNMSSISTIGFLAVKFASESYIEIDVGNEVYARSKKSPGSNFGFNSSKKVHSWIDYDGISKKIEVRASLYNDVNHSTSLVSCTMDLSYALWRDAMQVGIRSVNGNATVYSWSFQAKHGAPFLMHSEPLDPESISLRAHQDHPVYAREHMHWKIVAALLVGVVFGAIVASVVFFLKSKVVTRHPIAPFETDCEKNDNKIMLNGNEFQSVNAK